MLKLIGIKNGLTTFIFQNNYNMKFSKFNYQKKKTESQIWIRVKNFGKEQK